MYSRAINGNWGILISTVPPRPAVPEIELEDDADGDSMTVVTTCDAASACGIYTWDFVTGGWIKATLAAGGDANFTGTGAAQTLPIAVSPGWIVVKIESENAGGVSVAVDHERATDAAALGAVLYKVAEIRRMPGATENELVLEKLERPLNP